MRNLPAVPGGPVCLLLAAAASCASPAGNVGAAASAPSFEAWGPSWRLTIGGGQTTYIPAGGAGVTEPTPVKHFTVLGGFTYQGTRLFVGAVHIGDGGSCGQAPDGRSLPYAVEVRVDGNDVAPGCGTIFPQIGASRS